MNYDLEYFENLISTLIGWRLSGANNVISLCILSKMISDKKDKVKITTKDFINETNLSRQSVIKSTKYLESRSIIKRYKDESDNKSFLYSLIYYDMQNEKVSDGFMKTYKKNGNGYGSWQKGFSDGSKNYNKNYIGIDVDEWNYNDFSYFLKDYIVYSSKLWKIDISNINFILQSSLIRNQTYVNIVDYLDCNSGYNFCKLMLKAYLQWSVDNYFRKIISEDHKAINGIIQFSLGYFLNKSYMQGFLDEYDITDKTKSIKSVEIKLSNYRRVVKNRENKNKPINLISPSDMREYYKMGISTLLLECGIVLAGNYLINYENKSLKDSAEEIGSFLSSLNLKHSRQKKALQSIVEKTCLGSPYYKTMSFLDWKKVYNSILSKLENLNTDGFSITANKKLDNYSFFTKKMELNNV